MDGQFVPNSGLSHSLLRNLRSALAREGLPVPPFEAHLMVRRPSRFWRKFADAGAELVSFHLESDDRAAVLAEEVTRSGLSCGLCINPPTPFDRCVPFLEHFSFLVLMGVHPGLCGQRLLPGVAEKIHRAADYRRRSGLSYAIVVDGGVCAENAPQLVAAGADFLIAGKAIFGGENVQASYGELLQAIATR
jgi:ribulose-phosphate 3-epimerase